MKVFIIGSYNRENKNFGKFQKFCGELGKELIENKIDLILCSPFEGSADREVFLGIRDLISKNKYSSIELHYPSMNLSDDLKDFLEINKYPPYSNLKHYKDYIVIKEKWREIFPNLEDYKKNNSFFSFFYYPIEKNQENYDWLFVQLQALDRADVIISLGGNLDGSQKLLLRLAEAKDKIVVPIRMFDGISSKFIDQIKYKLIDLFGLTNFNLLESKNALKPNKLVQIISNNQHREESHQKNKNTTFFISYSKVRNCEADYVELILKRRGYIVLRDENNFRPSSDITTQIKEYIHQCDVFISLWSQEYACSPWCYDELDLALNLKDRNDKKLWILALDNTRMVHPKARNLLSYKVKTREEIEGRLLSLIYSRY